MGGCHDKATTNHHSTTDSVLHWAPSEYIRESTETGINGEQGRVELDPVIEHGDSGGDCAIPIRLVVALVEDEADRLFLLPVAEEVEWGKHHCGEGV